MPDWVLIAYPWIKALHVISVISWMAGMLYLPRLFVYHCGAEVGSEMSETFKVMEWKLSRYIMTPAMLASFAFGLFLVGVAALWGSIGAWLYLKLVLVVVLAAVHGLLMVHLKAFAKDRNARPDL